jgi:beta-N-acetylhexosaminidase
MVEAMTTARTAIPGAVRGTRRTSLPSRTGRPWTVGRLGGALAIVALLAGCTGGTAAGQGGETASNPTSSSAAPSPTVDPETPTGWGPTAGELARARDLVSAMPVAEQASTVLMPGFWGHDALDPTPAEALRNEAMHGVDSADEALSAHPFGGVFLRPEVIADADQVARLTGELHEVGDRPDGLPLLVSIDQEGGGVQRLKEGVAPVPSAASVGATDDPSYARRVALANGRTLRRLGVTMVMAPVADVDPDGRSVMGSRTYSPHRTVAARMVVATMRGYLQAGVIPVVKHFPGLGSVTGDSHHSLPEQPKTLTQLRRTDLVTFAAAVDAGAPVVMVGHVGVDALDPGVPASISTDVINGVLRDKLGFGGVAVTDSQGMGPINGPYNSAEGAVRSLVAGEDLVLNSPYPGRARRALVRAVRSGRLPADRLAEAATRVTALRIYQERIAQPAR